MENLKNINFIKVILVILSICFTAGVLGALISSGIEWSKIRYDYSDKKNNNNDAYALYILVTMAWALPVSIFVLSIVERLFSFLQKTFEFHFSILIKILLILLIVAGLMLFVVWICCIAFSTKNKCKTIREKGTEKGQESKEFIDYISNKIKDIPENERKKWFEDFDKERCDTYNIYISTFFGILTISAVIIIVISIIAYRKSKSYNNNPELEAE